MYEYHQEGALDPHLVPRCTLHYARGMAFANTGDVAAAQHELTAFHNLQKSIGESKTKRKLFNNTMSDIFLIAEQILKGEITYREAFLLRQGNTNSTTEVEDLIIESKFELAFNHLRQAVVLNDIGLVYDEPWGWMHPARHVLGALLLEQGFIAEAETVYREDLGISLSGENARCCHPNNIWSLRGLEECFHHAQSTSKQTLGCQTSESTQEQCKHSLPDDYDEIIHKLRSAEKLCDNHTLIPSSCACKQSWKLKQT